MHKNTTSAVLSLFAFALYPNILAHSHNHNYYNRKDEGGTVTREQALQPILQGIRTCGTSDPTDDELEMSDEVVRKWKKKGRRSRKTEIVVPIYWHVITFSGLGSIPDDVINKAVQVLNDAYTPHFSFKLNDTDHTETKDWFYGDKRDGEMKRSLRKGGCNALNVYTNDAAGESLGYAQFPWKCKAKDNPDSGDGVVIDYRTVPGGSLLHFNIGHTLTHEVGHWLGLYHTFHGGNCRRDGDHVDDTPPQKFANYDCDSSLDTCKKYPGKDPINNFMNYTPDRCYEEFTNGQFERMIAIWNEYRDESVVSYTLAPTLAPAPIPCPKARAPFSFEIKLDNYGNEVQFFVQRKKKGESGYFKKKVLSHSKFRSDSVEKINACLSKKECYRYLIKDSGGDGICCEFGEGWYQVTYNGNIVRYDNFEGTSKQNRKFGNC